jgi:hypothetical protein
MKRSRILIAAVALAALVASEPAAAFRGRAYHCGTFAGRSVGYHHVWRGRHWRYGWYRVHWRYGWRGGWAGRPAFAGGRGNPDYGYGYNCRNYGYGCNCPYYDLPDWNGPMEIRNPGG